MLPFTVERIAGATIDVVVVAGELDSATISELAPVYEQAVGDGRATVIADYSRVTFIDSMAIGQLIRLQSQLASDGRQLLVVSTLHKVRRVLSMVNLGRVIPIFDRLADAKLHAASSPAAAAPRRAADGL